MSKIYATKDWDGERIERNADIVAFDTRAEAEAWLRDGLDPTEWTIDITEGSFSDAWIKCISDPQSECSTLNCEPFTRDQLDIQAPGQHPGGSFWWVTPSPDVLVAQIEPIDAE